MYPNVMRHENVDCIQVARYEVHGRTSVNTVATIRVP
jgi:hypothetical protein